MELCEGWILKVDITKVRENVKSIQQVNKI